MSCKSCDAPSTATTCAARMSDGRVFTDYRPRCARNAELFSMVSQANMMKSAYESRMFLQHNTDKLMDSNRQWAIQSLAPCAPCPRPFSDAGTMLPERYMVRCDGVSCDRVEVNPNGIGDGRNYNLLQ